MEKKKGSRRSGSMEVDSNNIDEEMPWFDKIIPYDHILVIFQHKSIHEIR